jgi:hypothetical protein
MGTPDRDDAVDFSERVCRDLSAQGGLVVKCPLYSRRRMAVSFLSIAFLFNQARSYTPHSLTVSLDAQKQLQNLIERQYDLVAKAFYYAESFPGDEKEQDRIMLAGALKIVFANLNGLSRAQRDRKFDEPNPNRFYKEVGLYGGTEADWRHEVGVSRTTEISFSFYDGAAPLHVTFRYIDADYSWQLLDISLRAVVTEPESCLKIAETQRALVEYLRFHRS